MLTACKYLTYSFFFVGCFEVSGQLLSSPLSTGTWSRFSVTKNGLYKIDYNQLKSTGLLPDQVDPRMLQLYGNGTGMLPQPNDAPRINNLRELSIVVVGESDGVLNTEDYILFYGQGPDVDRYDTDQELFYYENHLYSDQNYYFLTVGADQGKRISNRDHVVGTYPLINTYNDYVYHETEQHNILMSGRQWFGERFSTSDEIKLSFSLPGIIEDTPIKVVSSVMAQAVATSSFRLSLNGSLISDQPIAPILDGRFTTTGHQRTDTILVRTPNLNREGDFLQQFTYRFSTEALQNPTGYLDFILVSYERILSLYGSQTLFRSANSLAYPVSTFEINSFPLEGLIWDVTDPFECMNQSYQKEQEKTFFSTPTNRIKNFIAVAPGAFFTPEWTGNVAPQDLYRNDPIDLLIVTHPDFKSEATRLAAHRQTHNGITVRVVTTEEVYNDYAGGKPDPTAIRDLVKNLFRTGLKNVLLLGRCSYDPKDRLRQNTYFVPTYQSRNSLSPLTTYSSDDYFVFLQDHEGEWDEDYPFVPHTLDVGIGRLPVKTIQEAKAIVDKLIAYDTHPDALGDWRKKILFVADDEDKNLHQISAESLARAIEADQPEFNVQKIYLDAFKQVSRASGQTSPDARNALDKALRKGTLIVNLTGHGSEEVWFQERILDELFIEEWKQSHFYPLLITATCEFGRHDDPFHISGGEKTLLKEDGGSIALITAARPVHSSSNAVLNKAFYDALFTKENGAYQDLGSVFKEMKNNSMTRTTVSNRNYALLGDPSMHLAIPENSIVVTQVGTAKGSDVLKAFSKVIVKGEIRSAGVKNNNFEGTLTAALMDKEFSFTTLGDLGDPNNTLDDNKPFTYGVRSSTLFRGTASIKNGSFRFECILPKNTASPMGSGKISLYAVDNAKQFDAFGGFVDFDIGGVETSPEEDNIPPAVRLFIGDTTFVNGGIASANTQLITMLSDQSGISIASYGGEHGLVAILDGEEQFDMSEYYFAATDDFTQGMAVLPLEELPSGEHTIELKAWDTYHNATSSTITFKVAQKNSPFIDRLFNYPNPFSRSTTVQFYHNRSGEDLRLWMTVLTLTGQIIDFRTYMIPHSLFLVILPEWKAVDMRGVQLKLGMYILKIRVRSLFDGSEDESYTKLIILD